MLLLSAVAGQLVASPRLPHSVYLLTATSPDICGEALLQARVISCSRETRSMPGEGSPMRRIVTQPESTPTISNVLAVITKFDNLIVSASQKQNCWKNVEVCRGQWATRFVDKCWLTRPCSIIPRLDRLVTYVLPQRLKEGIHLSIIWFSMPYQVTWNRLDSSRSQHGRISNSGCTEKPSGRGL